MSATRWTTLSEVPPKPVEWLWEGLIPLGKVTLLDGEPGSGKSLLAFDLAARVSRGAAMPMSQATAAPADVVLYNDDDNLADTVRPRLEAAGASLARVRAVDGLIAAEDLVEFRPALVVIDPLSAYLCLDCGVPTREILKKLSRLARDSGAAVLVVQNLPANDRAKGEIYDAARSALFISTIGHGRHRLALTKSNLVAVSDVPPLVYHLQATHHSVKITGWADSV
jgi:KaiC/GvpD/RAD55 family RecA-like ATPase